MTAQVQAGNWSKRNAKGRERPEGSSQSPPKAGTKSFNGIMKQFQIRNPTKLMEALASVGMRTFPQEHPNAGKGKGKGKSGKGKSNPDSHPPSPKGAKAKGKGKEALRAFVEVFGAPPSKGGKAYHERKHE